MEQSIKDRYYATVLQEAMQRYGIASNQIQPLAASVNFVYVFERGCQRYILRIGHSLHHREALVQGEIDWIHYLADHGIAVARAIRSEGGKLVEAIDDGAGGQFLATAFVKAPGQPVETVGWTPTLYEKYGHLLGSMHALAQHYQPAEATWKRPSWDDESLAVVERYLPASEAVAQQKYQALRARLHCLPKAKTVYGLIHQDAHSGNFLVDQAASITLFDFDDCVYSWFIADIAFVLFAIVMHVQDAPAFTQAFMPHFLQGYQRANSLDACWLKEIPLFLNLLEIEVYALMHSEFGASNNGEWWGVRFMRDRKYKIEQDLPYIDFDFESLSRYLG